MIAGAALAGLLASPFRPAGGDFLAFRDGGEVEVPVEVSGDRLTVRTPGREFEFRRDDFRAIVPSIGPEREWPGRWQLARSEARSAFAAAWWAVEHGLIKEGAAALRVVVALEPTHEPAGQLVRLLEELDEPCDDPEEVRRKPWLDRGFREARGPHILLIHRHAEAEAERRVAELERVLTAAYLLFGSLGLEPEVPLTRLMVVWFDEERAFEEFVRREAGSAQPGVSGYYSPARHLSATLDPRAQGWYRRTIDGDRGPGTDAGRRDRARRDLLLELRRESADLGTAAHELAHLVMADSGVARPGERPLWLLEGLATQFEVVRGGRWAGFGPVNASRLDDWRSATSPPSLTRLLREDELGRGYQEVPYAAAWSWTYFLRKCRPEVLLDFLEARPGEFVTGAPSGSAHPETTDLEPSWHEFVAGLRGPLGGPPRSDPR